MRTSSSRLNDLTAREWVRSTKSWFVCDGRFRDITPDIQQHPASFPPEMLDRFIRFFTVAGQTVLDPFVGCGSTLVAASAAGRKSIGIELSQPYWENTNKRILQLPGAIRLIHGDARQAASFGLDCVDYVITSPPYWTMLKKSRGHAASNHKRRAILGLDTDYGEEPGDLGRIEDYDEYLDALVAVFSGLKPCLKPGCYLTVVLQNIRVASGEMVPLAWDFARLMRRHFKLQQEALWCQNQKRLACWGYPSVFVSNVHHHYCLNFRN